MTRIFILIVALVFFVGLSNDVFAQNYQQKTQNIIAELRKTKHKKKEKRGITVESYSDIRSEPVIKNNARDYAGVYQSSDADYRIELRVLSDGRVEGSGYDADFNHSQRQDFTLVNGRIEGALLTATKVYTDGRTRKLEAVFSNQTRVEGRNPNQINNSETKYGLGFIDSYVNSHVTVIRRIFLEFNS